MGYAPLESLRVIEVSTHFRPTIYYILLFAAYISNTICNRTMTYTVMLGVFPYAVFESIGIIATQWASRHT